MEPGCAGNSSLLAGKKRPDLDDDGMMKKDDWTGTKKSKKLHEYQVGGGGGLSRSRKRPYEYGEDEYEDVWMEKLYKCNYWEDPAYAKKIEFFGLELARDAAFDNHCERLHRDFEAWMAARRRGDASTTQTVRSAHRYG